jgi:hypothetical protein
MAKKDPFEIQPGEFVGIDPKVMVPLLHKVGFSDSDLQKIGINSFILENIEYHYKRSEHDDVDGQGNKITPQERAEALKKLRNLAAPGQAKNLAEEKTKKSKLFRRVRNVGLGVLATVATLVGVSIHDQNQKKEAQHAQAEQKIKLARQSTKNLLMNSIDDYAAYDIAELRNNKKMIEQKDLDSLSQKFQTSTLNNAYKKDYLMSLKYKKESDSTVSYQAEIDPTYAGGRTTQFTETVKKVHPAPPPFKPK